MKNLFISVFCDGALHSWRPRAKSRSWCFLLLRLVTHQGISSSCFDSNYIFSMYWVKIVSVEVDWEHLHPFKCRLMVIMVILCWHGRCSDIVLQNNRLRLWPGITSDASNFASLLSAIINGNIQICGVLNCRWNLQRKDHLFCTFSQMSVPSSEVNWTDLSLRFYCTSVDILGNVILILLILLGFLSKGFSIVQVCIL